MPKTSFSFEALKAASIAPASTENDQEFHRLLALGTAESVERQKQPGYFIQNDPLSVQLACAAQIRHMGRS